MLTALFGQVQGQLGERLGEEAVELFELGLVLEELGANATVRRNRGTDIDAACGQLAAGQPVELRPTRPARPTT